MSLLGTDIPAIVNESIGPLLLDASITRKNRVHNKTTDEVTNTDVTYTTKGFVDEYSNYERENSTIETGDRKIFLLAEDLGTTPKVGDEVTIEGETFRAIDVKPDPAKATYTIQGRV